MCKVDNIFKSRFPKTGFLNWCRKLNRRTRRLGTLIDEKLRRRQSYITLGEQAQEESVSKMKFLRAWRFPKYGFSRFLLSWKTFSIWTNAIETRHDIATSPFLLFQPFTETVIPFHENPIRETTLLICSSSFGGVNFDILTPSSSQKSVWSIQLDWNPEKSTTRAHLADNCASERRNFYFIAEN